MKSKKVNWGHVIVFIILILCMIVTLLPFVWMILTSLKTQAESICIPLKIFPEKPLFSNYAAVFTKIPFAKMYLNTAVTATVIVVVQLILCSMAAYAFGRIKFPGRNIIFGTLLAVLMVPSSFFYPATVSDDTENGIVKYNTGVIYTGIVQCFWNISDETVFLWHFRTNWKMRRELTVAIIL
ncbi:MAG: hypothetical protein ACLTUL_08070 [Blautia faecis]